MKKFNILPYVLVFLATYFILQWFQGSKAVDPVLSTGDVGLKTNSTEYVTGSDIRVELQNNTTASITIPSGCPNSPFTVSEFTSTGYVPITSTVERDCSSAKDTVVEPGKTASISLLDYSYSLFGDPGKYKITLNLANGEFFTPEFDVTEPGLIKNLWRTFLYNPLLNALIAILIYTPGHSLWLAILILTLFIRTLLLIPSQRAMKAQKRMQEVQPKIEELKKKYADDQSRLAQETMLLWKTSKVSPFSSCLPLLIQFPILIALYYSINGGLSPDSHALIYPALSAFSLNDVNPHFLGFNLFEKSLIVFPLVIGGLQFLQMQLMTKMSKKSGADKLPNEIQTANTMMKYMMPIMIAIFTAQLPAAVGLYWGVSTCYGILQQIVVNKEGPESKKPDGDDDVQVRVINKPHN